MLTKNRFTSKLHVRRDAVRVVTRTDELDSHLSEQPSTSKNQQISSITSTHYPRMNRKKRRRRSATSSVLQ